MNVGLNEIPSGLIAPLAVLVVVQVSLAIFALITLFRTPDERLIFGKKWPWVLIILFINVVGAIVFLAAGRKPEAATDPLAGETAAAPQSDRASRAADVLYGKKDGSRL